MPASARNGCAHCLSFSPAFAVVCGAPCYDARIMRRLHLFPLWLLLLLPALAWAATNLPAGVVTGTAFIVNYSETGAVVGYGSAFFVGEDTVVTNRHVLEKGSWHRVYAVGEDEKVFLRCYVKVTKEWVMIHPDDDVAYLHAPLPCGHSILHFADDPVYDDPVYVLGFPYRGSASIELSLTTGRMLGQTTDGWFITDAQMDRGNSGGPVIDGINVLGVAVAKGLNASGEFVEAYFIPSSIIESGLIHSGNILFPYTPRSSSSSSSSSSSQSSRASSRSSVSSNSSRRSLASAKPAGEAGSSSSRRQRDIFSDVSRSREGYAAIMTLYEEGIISGYSDPASGSGQVPLFRPDAGINRAEFLKILVAGFRKEKLNGETRCFIDVRDEWFAPYVCAAKRLGWISGNPDGTFRPADRINRAEAIKIVTEAFGAQQSRVTDFPSDVRAGTWYRSYVAMGITMGIIDEDVLFHPARDLTREEAAMWIWGAEHSFQ